GPMEQPEGGQRRQVFVVNVAEESLRYPSRSQANAFRRWSHATERSLVAVPGKGRGARDTCSVGLGLVPYLGKDRILEPNTSAATATQNRAARRTSPRPSTGSPAGRF